MVQNATKGRMQRAREIDFLVLGCPSLDDFEETNNPAALIVCKVQSGGIADPAMDTSPSGIYPKQMLKAEVV